MPTFELETDYHFVKQFLKKCTSSQSIEKCFEKFNDQLNKQIWTETVIKTNTDLSCVQQVVDIFEKALFFDLHIGEKKSPMLFPLGRLA